MTVRSRALIATLLFLLGTAAILLAMGRPLICSCGEVTLWGPVGPMQSQMLADWYSPSHIVHGLLFYAILWLVARSWPVERRLMLALAIEAAWEIIENTPMVIDRYREATIALGYTGDSILNSLSDVAMMPSASSPPGVCRSGRRSPWFSLSNWCRCSSSATISCSTC